MSTEELRALVDRFEAELAGRAKAVSIEDQPSVADAPTDASQVVIHPLARARAGAVHA